MSLYKQFETDVSVEQKGVLLEYGNNSKGQPIRIRIARAGGSNTAYLKLLEARCKPYRRVIQNESIERPMLEGILRGVYAETVVIGWENVEDREGNELPFSKENALKLFNDLPDLYADIVEQSTKTALFRKDLQEADAKN